MTPGMRIANYFTGQDDFEHRVRSGYRLQRLLLLRYPSVQDHLRVPEVDLRRL